MNQFHQGLKEDLNNNAIYGSPILDFQNSISFKDIQEEKLELELNKMISKPAENTGMLTVKSANWWIEQAKNRSVPKTLFDDFWFESELCILFADTGIGKSILAVQIGESICSGKEIPGFKLNAPKQRILYYDFEMGEKQFENRYSLEYKNHYLWDENFFRVEINTNSEFSENQTFEDYLYHSIEQSIIETNAKILIVDNLTYLKNQTEKAKDALPLMKHLKYLKNKYNLSILVLAHTPKRDSTKPITRNDLQGSKMLINFCDSSFTIGESQHDKNLRYLKQIKVRHSEFKFDAENVCVCQIEKPHNFLQFTFIKFSTEREHLKEITEKNKTHIINEVIELKNKGYSNIEIGRRFNVSEGSIRNWIKKGCEFDPLKPV